MELAHKSFQLGQFLLKRHIRLTNKLGQSLLPINQDGFFPLLPKPAIKFKLFEGIPEHGILQKNYIWSADQIFSEF